MKCPVCGNALSEVKAGSILVHACQNGCGGLWINHFQLDKIDMPDEYDGEILTQLQNKANIKIDVNQPLHCPQCPDKIVMMRHFFSVKREVLINECPECGGYFLYMGELLKIREQFHSEAEKAKATDDYFNAMFGKQMKQDLNKEEVWVTKADKVYDLFKYICPTHYFMNKGWNRPY